MQNKISFVSHLARQVPTADPGVHELSLVENHALTPSNFVVCVQRPLAGKGEQ
jgi:hypothetical protein